MEFRLKEWAIFTCLLVTILGTLYYRIRKNANTDIIIVDRELALSEIVEYLKTLKLIRNKDFAYVIRTEVLNNVLKKEVNVPVKSGYESLALVVFDESKERVKVFKLYYAETFDEELKKGLKDNPVIQLI